MEMNKELELGLQEGQEEYTDEDIMEVLSKILPRIILNSDDLEDCSIDKKEFQKGIKEMSKDCGKIVALLNIGLSADLAVDFILARDGGSFNKKAVEAMERQQL